MRNNTGAQAERPDPHEQIKQKGLQKMEGTVAGAVITASDRCFRGETEDRSGPLAAQLFAKWGVIVDEVRVVPDGVDSVRSAILDAMAAGARVILTTGGTGVTDRDLTPEATAPLLDARLDAIAMQIAQVGLANTPLASLSRGLVGVSRQGDTPAFIVNAPGSRGGVKDTISVIGPLVPHVLEQLDLVTD